MEIHIPIQGQQESVLCPDLFLLLRQVMVVLQHVAQEVVHVHALGPALLVPDLGLVLQMADDLRLAGQSPDKAAAVRCWVALWWTHL